MATRKPEDATLSRTFPRPDPITISRAPGQLTAPAVPSLANNEGRRAFHAAKADAVAQYWASSLETGLDPDEVVRRLERLGQNRLAEAKPPSLITRLIAQVSDFTVLALIGAAVIAAALSIFAPEPGVGFLGRFGDSIAILLIVVLNAILGLVQEAKAENALKALRDMTAPSARVLRGGKVVEVAATQIVPGDLVLLEEGDMVPADCRLVGAADLEIEEAALTGESMPVQKDASLVLDAATPLADRTNMAFMGTRVARGRGRALVANTGMHTELGSIAGMLAAVEEEETPLQKQLNIFGKQIVIGCIVVSAIVFAAGWLLAGHPAREMFLVAVSVAVAAIPEGLPAITTITLALGTTRMAKRHALIRKLPAIETLGCTQVVCTDKTGTLTQNAMSVRAIWVDHLEFEVAGGARELTGQVTRQDGSPVQADDIPDLETLYRASALANGARLTPDDTTPGSVTVTGDPTDAALLVLAHKGGVQVDENEIVGDVPFTSARRRATVVTKHGAFTRGAPEQILELCDKMYDEGVERPINDADRDEIHRVAAAWGKKAMRVLALARRTEAPAKGADLAAWEEKLSFVGLVGIVDPPRPEVKAAVAAASAAGIRSVMITGDHPATARAIAEEIGLWKDGDVAVTGAELEQLDQQRLEAMIGRLRVVARATAAHKLRIIEAFKARGQICAMTGDGVNDAPAVKAAHIGIAMGKAGTEVTKEASDLVLADDNYATIIAAVEEGRAIFANIRKFIYFLLSSNAGLVIVVLVASLLGWAAPLTPIQILWINLITNGLPALALGIDSKDPDQMKKPPRAMDDRLMDRQEWTSLLGVGSVMAAAAIFAFWVGGGTGGDPAELPRARTLAFMVLSFSPMFHALNCRSQTRSIFQLGLFSNRALWGAIVVGVALILVALYVPALWPVFKTAPLSGSDLLFAAAISSLPLIIGETIKAVLRGRPAAVKPA